MALPAIRDVRRHFAGAHLTVAARPSVAEVFRAVAGRRRRVDAAEPEDESLSCRRTVRHRDSVSQFVSIGLDRSDARACRERWGYRVRFSRRAADEGRSAPEAKVHFGEYYQQLVRELGVETGPLTPRIESAGAMVEAAAAPCSRSAAGNPAAADGHRARRGVRPREAWPAKRYAALIGMLRDELGCGMRAARARRDRDASQAIEDALETTGVWSSTWSARPIC